MEECARPDSAAFQFSEQLAAAALVWAIVVHGSDTGLTPGATASIVSLAGGALLANVVSVVLLVIETVMLRR